MFHPFFRVRVFFMRLSMRLFSGIIGRNVKRFTACGLIACAATVIMTSLVRFLIGIIGGMLGVKTFPILYWYLAGVIIGAIAEFITVSIADGICKFASSDNREYKPIKSKKLTLKLSIVILVTGVAIGLFVYYKDVLMGLIENDGEFLYGNITTALGVFTAAPVIFVFGMTCFYYEYKCSECKSVFGMEENLCGAHEGEYIQNKNETERAHIGTVNADGQKIADVYGDVEHSYQRSVTVTTEEYELTCPICGNRFKRRERHKSYGSWKESR